MNYFKSKKQFIYRFIFIIALIVFLFSGYKLFTIYKANWEENSEKDRITSISKIPTDIKKNAKFKVDFKKLSEINPDVVAWIVVPDTDISYPIVQGKDNDYYLNHTFEKRENYAGAIFNDYAASPNYSDLNTFIYGHNIKHGTMFSDVQKFKDQAFFEAHPYLYIFTPEKKYKCDIMSMYSTDASSDSYINGYTSWDGFSNYVNLIKSKAMYARDVAFGEGDHMITLSTCSYERGGVASDARYLLHAKLVEWNDTSK
ncbi:MAG: class B sortase [Erysipelotrichaceae bacterium]